MTGWVLRCPWTGEEEKRQTVLLLHLFNVFEEALADGKEKRSRNEGADSHNVTAAATRVILRYDTRHTAMSSPEKAKGHLLDYIDTTRYSMDNLRLALTLRFPAQGYLVLHGSRGGKAADSAFHILHTVYPGSSLNLILFASSTLVCTQDKLAQRR